MSRQRKDPNDLNDKEKLFCTRYVANDQNGTRAYKSVWRRVTNNTARTEASKLLAKPNVSAEVRRLIDEGLKASHATANEVLREMSWIGLSDPAELVGLNGEVRNLRQIPERLRRCIKGIKRNRDGTYEFQFWSKDHQLTNLGKFHKLLTERIELSGKVALAIRVQAARKRVDL